MRYLLIIVAIFGLLSGCATQSNNNEKLDGIKSRLAQMELDSINRENEGRFSIKSDKFTDSTSIAWETAYMNENNRHGNIFSIHFDAEIAQNKSTYTLLISNWKYIAMNCPATYWLLDDKKFILNPTKVSTSVGIRGVGNYLQSNIFEMNKKQAQALIRANKIELKICNDDGYTFSQQEMDGLKRVGKEAGLN